MSGKEKGRWVTIEGRHIFIRDGESVDSALKRAYGKDVDANKKDKQIENNKKQADELNHREHKSSQGYKSVLTKDSVKKIVKEETAKKSVEGPVEGGYRLHDDTICKKAPDDVDSSENGKYFSPDGGKTWYEMPKYDEPDWGDNPPAPKLPVGTKKEPQKDPDDDMYDITDKYYPGTDLKKDLFNSDKLYAVDRTTRFVAGVGKDAQTALDILSDNAQGIFVDCPHQTEVSFKNAQGELVSAKARVDNQGRTSWTIRIDNKRSGSGWSSRDLAEMLPSDPKDFSMYIPESTYAKQPEVTIKIEDGKVSKSIKTSKKPYYGLIR